MRFSYALRSTSLSGRWEGRCRRHGELVVEPVSIDWQARSTAQRMAAIGERIRSAEAVVDPETRARRRRIAEQLHREGRLPPELRPYLDDEP